MISLETSRDPSAPFVTFYDGDRAERTELSGTSFANWQAKTANYLRDGFGLEAANRINLRLPLHWIVPVWVAAARHLDVAVSITDGANVPELTDVAVVGPKSISDAPTTCDVVACSLRPLAQPFADRLPVGVEDFFAEVRNYGDHLDPATAAQTGAPVFSFDGDDLSHTEVADAIESQINKFDLSKGARLLLSTNPAPSGVSHQISPEQLLACYDLPTKLGGSVVLAVNQTAAQLEEIARQERVTDHLAT